MQWFRQWFKEDKIKNKKFSLKSCSPYGVNFSYAIWREADMANGSFKSCFFYCWLTELPEETFSVSGLKSWNWLQSNFLNKWIFNLKTVKIMVYLKLCTISTMCLFIHKTPFQRKKLNLVIWIVLFSLYLAEIMNNLNGEITACSNSDCYL